MSRKRKHQTKLPKNNGRPQLWMRVTGEGFMLDSFERIRIIYPDGKAEYSTGVAESGWHEPCWLDHRVSLKTSVENMLEFDKNNRHRTIFLGYL